MRLTRRCLLAASAVWAARAVAAAAPDPKGPRTLGAATAAITVTEFFSLTCTHCAAFMRDSFPAIKQRWVDSGKVRWVFVDYPLDRVALTAAMVARALPETLYEPFVQALYQDQLHWAFNPDLDPTEGLAREAALAGIPRSDFDRIAADGALQAFVLQERTDATDHYSIDGTPTFRADGPKARGQQFTGEMSVDEFAGFLAKVG